MAGRVDDPLSAGRRATVREGSAGGLVARRRGARWEVVLVARRHRVSGALLWGIPKGHVEVGESPEQAALREVREETGLDAAIVGPLGEIAYRFARTEAARRGERVQKRVRFFLMRWRGGRFADRDDEMDAVRWFPLDAAERVAAHENERALLRAARARLEAGEAP